MLSDKILEINNESLQYDSSEGVFFIYYDAYKTISDTYICREDLQYDYQNFSKFVGFGMHENVKPELVNQFFELIENRLGLDEKSTVYKTNKNKCVIIKLSPFWREDCTHKSFFSLMLRCAGRYYNGDFDAAINNYILARRSKVAIKHFLDGCTIDIRKDKKDNEGSYFVKNFSEYEPEELSKVLVRKSRSAKFEEIWEKV